MEWTHIESENYVFNYKKESFAEKDIHEISEFQEKCYEYICKVLGGRMNQKIEYYLCESPDEVGRIYGDNDPCNGFACRPNKVYAVYNEKVKCIGLHEDAHIVSYEVLGRPNEAFLREGLVMFFDRGYLGISNMMLVKGFINKGIYKKISKLIENQEFFSHSDRLTYPIAGAFVEYLVSTYGLKAFLSFYRGFDEEISERFKMYFQDELEKIESDFEEYIGLSNIRETDDVLNYIKKMN